MNSTSGKSNVKSRVSRSAFMLVNANTLEELLIQLNQIADSPFTKSVQSIALSEDDYTYKVLVLVERHVD